MVTIEINKIWLSIISFIVGYGGASIILNILKLVSTVLKRK